MIHDRDAFCAEWDNISRADATGCLMIAWSKAIDGEMAALGAMGISPSIASPIAATSAAATEPKTALGRRANSNAACVSHLLREAMQAQRYVS